MAAPRVTINDLPAKTTVSPSDLLVVQEGAVTKKMAMSVAFDANGVNAHIIDPVDAHLATAIGATSSGTGMDGSTVQAQLGQAYTLINNNAVTAGNALTQVTDHIADATDAHDASAISASDAGHTLLVGVDVQAQLDTGDAALVVAIERANEAKAEIDGHMADPVGAHQASAVSTTAIGATPASTVQDLLAALLGRTISTTAPLTGGGDLSANRTLGVDQFGSASPGVVPPSGGGNSNFLRADGAWAAPSASMPDGSVTNAKLTGMAANTIKGQDATAGEPMDLTVAQVTAMLDLFSATLRGLVPPSGGGSTTFLRADGTWQVPPGGGGGGGASTQVDVYNTPGTFTWTKPIGAKTVTIAACGGGGGGGAGRRGAAGSVRCGGGGGGAGAGGVLTYNASDLPATLSVTVGAGGAGGTISANDTNGGPGTAGTTTQVISSSPTAFWINCPNGSPGGGGTNAAGTSGGGGTGMYTGGTGGAASVSGGAGVNGGSLGASHAAGGGGSGGGISSGDATAIGGGGRVGNWSQNTTIPGGASHTTLAGTNGTDGGATLQTIPVTTSSFQPGAGGGGGGTGPGGGGNGGAGVRGGGGGGGGGTLNGTTGGNGGRGGDGIVVITTHF